MLIDHIFLEFRCLAVLNLPGAVFCLGREW